MLLPYSKTILVKASTYKYTVEIDNSLSSVKTTVYGNSLWTEARSETDESREFKTKQPAQRSQN